MLLRRMLMGSAPTALRATVRASPAMYTPRRRLHVAAAGSFNTYNESAAVDRLPERTMLSTLLSRREVMRANPQFRGTLRNLNRAGHRVHFGVDATRLDDASHAPAVSMALAARRHNIDMSKMHVSFLRSHDETPQADSRLLSAFALSARRSGVKKLTAFHSRKIFAHLAHGAPNEDDWTAAASSAGFRRVRTGVDGHSRLVESVPRPDGSVQRVPMSRTGTGMTEFES